MALATLKELYEGWDSDRVPGSVKIRQDDAVTDTVTSGARSDSDVYGQRKTQDVAQAETVTSTTRNTFNSSQAARNIAPITINQTDNPQRVTTNTEDARTDNHNKGQQIDTNAHGARKSTETDYTDTSDAIAKFKRVQEIESLLFAQLLDMLRNAIDAARYWS